MAWAKGLEADSDAWALGLARVERDQAPNHPFVSKSEHRAA